MRPRMTIASDVRNLIADVHDIMLDSTYDDAAEQEIKKEFERLVNNLSGNKSYLEQAKYSATAQPLAKSLIKKIDSVVQEAEGYGNARWKK